MFLMIGAVEQTYISISMIHHHNHHHHCHHHHHHVMTNAGDAAADPEASDGVQWVEEELHQTG